MGGGGGAPKISRDRKGTRERRQLSPDEAQPGLELSRGSLNCGSPTPSAAPVLAPGHPPRPLCHHPSNPGRNLRDSRAVPAASFRAPGARDQEAARLEPRRALSATRAALAAAGGKAHASEGEKPKAREPQRRRDLARVKRLFPRSRVCARLPSPDAPPSLPASRPARPARPRRRPLSRNFPGIRLT